MNAQPNQDDVAAFMEGLGATYNRDGSYYKDGRAIDDKEVQFWYTTLQQSNRQLLEEVEAAGPKNMSGNPNDNYINGLNATNQAWHQAIQAIKERLGHE